MGLRYLMSEEARELRRQLVLSLTEDDRLHFEELQRLWHVVSPDLSPAHLWQAALGSLPGDLQHALGELREQMQAHLERLSHWRLPQPWPNLLAGVGQER